MVGITFVCDNEGEDGDCEQESKASQKLETKPALDSDGIEHEVGSVRLWPKKGLQQIARAQSKRSPCASFKEDTTIKDGGVLEGKERRNKGAERAHDNCDE